MNTFRLPKIVAEVKERMKRPPIVLPAKEEGAVVDRVVNFPEPAHFSQESVVKENCWRVGESDQAAWLSEALPMLKEQFPYLSVEAMNNWSRSLSSVLAMKDLLLVRTETSWGFFVMRKWPWAPNGIVQEEWTVFSENRLDNLDLLYRKAVDWAIDCQAKCVRIRPAKAISMISEGLAAVEGNRWYEISW